MLREQADKQFTAQMFGVDRLIRSHLLSERGQNSRSDTQLIHIPVVFHIMHQQGSENISDSLIQVEVDRLNDAFRNRNYFNQGRGVDMYLEFCLATISPNGQATAGINRILSPYTALSSQAQNYAMRQQYSWDTERYLNIFTAKSITFSMGTDTLNLTATSSFPNDAGTAIDAISLRADQIGLQDPSESSVLVHEVGHYLGLYHSYHEGCANFDCMIQGDRVCDTPPDSRAVTFEGCISNNNCGTDSDDLSSQNPYVADVPDMNNLYLDYNDYPCRNAFTAGQRDRVRATLRVIRPLLGNNYMCQARAGTDLALFYVPEAQEPVCGQSYAPKLRLWNMGDVDIHDFHLNVFLNNGFVFTQHFVRTIPPRSGITLVIPSFGIPSGQSEVKITVDFVNNMASSYLDNDTLIWRFNKLKTIQPPIQVDFEQGWPRDWPVFNPQGQGFEALAHGCDPAAGDSYCAGLGTRLYYDLGVEDGFYSPLLDLSGYRGAWLSFDVAYSLEDQVTLFDDKLEVSVSRDCGISFDPPIYQKDQHQLKTHDRMSDTTDIWAPTSCLAWRRDSVPLHQYAGDEILLKFVFSKYQNGNPIYIDNISIVTEWGLNIEEKYENPFSLTALDEGILCRFDQFNAQPKTLICYDVHGQKIAEWHIPAGENEKLLSFVETNGLYFFHLKQQHKTSIQKWIWSRQ